MLGTLETVHCGTPVLVMPQIGDQFINGAFSERHGNGAVMYLSDATEELFREKLMTVLSER